MYITIVELLKFTNDNGKVQHTLCMIILEYLKFTVVNLYYLKNIYEFEIILDEKLFILLNDFISFL